MFYLLGLLAAIVLLFIGAAAWIRWFQVFDGPGGAHAGHRAPRGPYAVQVDVDDGPGHRYSRPDPRHQGGGGR